VREREFRALCSYVREVMDIMGLPQWKLIMMRDRPDDAGPDAEGYCSPLFGQHTVNMWFDPNLPRQIPVRSRYVVVHEIMHIPLHACWQSWSQPLMNDGLIARTTYDAIVANGITTWEMCIDTLARPQVDPEGEDSRRAAHRLAYVGQGRPSDTRLTSMATSNVIGDRLEELTKKLLGGKRVLQSGGGRFWKCDVNAGTFIVSCKATDKDYLRVTKDMLREVKEAARGMRGSGDGKIPAMVLGIGGEAYMLTRLEDQAAILTADPASVAYIEPTKGQARLAASRRSFLG
jgi:hypothetical protein